MFDNRPEDASPTRVRRVLGELTPNTRHVVQRPLNALNGKSITSKDTTPLKATRSPTRVDMLPSNTFKAMGSPFAGKKRTIDEVDGPYNASYLANNRRAEQKQELMSGWATHIARERERIAPSVS